MDEQTKSPFPENGNGNGNGTHKDSSLFGLSSRSLIVFLICGTVCFESASECFYMIRAGKDFKVEEPLYSLVIMTVGYYFGQNQKTQTKI